MGSVLFTCSCGQFGFLDSTDDRSYAGYLMPEREWLPFWDAVDQAVASEEATPRERERACMALRAWPARQVWQCPACGALYLEDADGARHRFVPESAEVPRDLLRPVEGDLLRLMDEAPLPPDGEPPPAEEDPRRQIRERLEACRRMGEEAYDRMYDATTSSDATGRYSDAKEAFHDAIQAARELGLEEEVEALEARLAHIKAVFRAQSG